MPVHPSLRVEKGQWAVLFISRRADDPPGYADMDRRTMEEVARLPGFLGWDSARESPSGIFISYWSDREAIDRWRHHSLHLEAKAEGRLSWYDFYRSLVCRIEEAREFARS